MYTDQPELERSVQDINKKQKSKRTRRKIENSIKEFFEEESLKNKSVFHDNKSFSNINSFIYIKHKICYYSPGDRRLSKKNRPLFTWQKKQMSIITQINT